MAEACIRLLDGYIEISGVSTADTLKKIKKEVLDMKELANKGLIRDIIKAHRR